MDSINIGDADLSKYLSGPRADAEFDLFLEAGPMEELMKTGDMEGPISIRFTPWRFTGWRKWWRRLTLRKSQSPTYVFMAVIEEQSEHSDFTGTTLAVLFKPVTPPVVVENARW